MLCDYLNCHPMVACEYEILNRGEIQDLNACRSKTDVRFYLNTLFKVMRASVKGGKIHFSHFDQFGLDVGELVHWFPRARFIVLYRASLLTQFVSLKRAQLTNRWIATHPDEEDTCRLSLDVPELLAFLDTTRRRYRELVQDCALRGRYLMISYEELATDATSIFTERIWPFLNLPPAPVSTSSRKQNLLPLEETVTNLAEVKVAVEGSRSCDMLDSFNPESF